MIGKIKINDNWFEVISSRRSTVELKITESDIRYFEDWIIKCSSGILKYEYVQDLTGKSIGGRNLKVLSCFPISLNTDIVMISYDFMKWIDD